MKEKRSARAGTLFFALYAIMVCSDISYAQPPIAVPDGYAIGTTGGAGGSVVTATSASAFKSACESATTMIIVVKGNLGDIGQVQCKSNKTITGFDTTAGYTGNLAFSGVSNVIVQNLHIRNPDGIGTSDGIESSSLSTRIFVTKCTFTDCKDGSYDMKRGSDFLTVSWCRWRYPTIAGHNFPNLIGHDDANGTQDRGKLHITMHHNWYDAGCDSRMPRVRFGSVHVYNNFYNCTGNNYCIGTGVECKIRVENCVFENVNKAWNDMEGMANGGQIGWNNLKFVSASTPTYAPNKWPVFTPSYSFDMSPLDGVREMVIDPVYGAGNRLFRNVVPVLCASGKKVLRQVSLYQCTRNSLRIQTTGSKRLYASVFTLDGREMVATKFNSGSETGGVEIPLDGLRNGTYLIRLEHDESVQTGYIHLLR